MYPRYMLFIFWCFWQICDFKRDFYYAILMHNHPSGDPAPSPADVDMTKRVVEALRPLHIAVHDHLVVGRDGVASFKALALL